MKEKEELMKFTNKLNTSTLYQRKVGYTIIHVNEILGFVLYYKALGNAVTSIEV